MKQAKIIFKEKQFTLEEVKASAPIVSNEYEKKVLDFCHQWLSGKDRFCIPTSGSTGPPKIIEISRAQMIYSASITIKALCLQKAQSCLINLNIQYIAGMMMLVRGLEYDMQMTIVEPSGNPLESFSNQENFNFLSFVPLQLINILNDQPEKIILLNKAKAIIIGGAAIPVSLEEKIKRLTAPVYSTYGMTETVSHIALRKLNGENKSDEFKILDGVEIKQDDRNCLMIKSSVTKNEWIITNDLVKITKTKSFILLGRIDNVINSAGVKIQAETVERAVEEGLYEMNCNTSFFITALRDEKFGEALTLVFECKEKNIDEEKLKTILKSKLSTYEIPKRILYKEKFTLTPNGKTDRLATIKNI